MTTLRPDMVLLSRSIKTILVVELSVPCRLAISHELKKAKYQDLIDNVSIKGCSRLPHLPSYICALFLTEDWSGT